MGLGDAKLMILAGAWLGTRSALLALGLAAAQGLLFALAARVARREVPVPVAADRALGARWGLPFGPFLVLGILERMLLGPRMDAVVTLRLPW